MIVAADILWYATYDVVEKIAHFQTYEFNRNLPPHSGCTYDIYSTGTDCVERHVIYELGSYYILRKSINLPKRYSMYSIVLGNFAVAGPTYLVVCLTMST